MTEKKDDESLLDDIDKGVLLRLPLVVIIAAIVGLVSAVLAAFGLGDRINVGGLIGKMLNQNRGKDPIDIANSKPEDRDADVGETGKEGFKQRKVEVLEQSGGLFRDKSVIKVEGSKGKEKVKLPEGVQDRDVKEVYEIEPGEFSVEVKSKPDSGLTDEDIEKLREKL